MNADAFLEALSQRETDERARRLGPVPEANRPIPRRYRSHRPPEERHGTYSDYAKGCRCEPCTKAMSLHKRAYYEGWDK